MIKLNQMISEELSGCEALWLIVEIHNSKFIVCAYLVMVGGSHEHENIWINWLISGVEVEAYRSLQGCCYKGFPAIWVQWQLNMTFPNKLYCDLFSYFPSNYKSNKYLWTIVDIKQM